jgi:uncharacterized membrane protein YagU involved in acid resistance
MATASATFSIETPQAIPAIFWGGLLCGILDFTAACVTWGIRAGVRPIRIAHSIASGLLGASAYQGGWRTAVLGVALHFFIAFTAATVFYLASRKFSLLIRQAILCGVLYGMAVQLFMSQIVVPLSAFLRRPGPFSWTNFTIAIITHIFCVGLPISLSVRHLSK